MNNNTSHSSRNPPPQNPGPLQLPTTQDTPTQQDIKHDKDNYTYKISKTYDGGDTDYTCVNGCAAHLTVNRENPEGTRFHDHGQDCQRDQRARNEIAQGKRDRQEAQIAQMNAENSHMDELEELFLDGWTLKTFHVKSLDAVKGFGTVYFVEPPTAQKGTLYIIEFEGITKQIKLPPLGHLRNKVQLDFLLGNCLCECLVRKDNDKEDGVFYKFLM